jgi:hypothetical protein
MKQNLQSGVKGGDPRMKKLTTLFMALLFTFAISAVAFAGKPTAGKAFPAEKAAPKMMEEKKAEPAAEEAKVEKKEVKKAKKKAKKAKKAKKVEETKPAEETKGMKEKK